MTRTEMEVLMALHGWAAIVEGVSHPQYGRLCKLTSMSNPLGQLRWVQEQYPTEPWSVLSDWEVREIFATLVMCLCFTAPKEYYASGEIDTVAMGDIAR